MMLNMVNRKSGKRYVELDVSGHVSSGLYSMVGPRKPGLSGRSLWSSAGEGVIRPCLIDDQRHRGLQLLSKAPTSGVLVSERLDTVCSTTLPTSQPAYSWETGALPSPVDLVLLTVPGRTFFLEPTREKCFLVFCT
jgi:hypothetical protein